MSEPNVEIRDEAQYQAAVQALATRNRPSWLLRLLMNALERYRQKRKMGWSRPQNKQGLTVFGAYSVDRNEDRGLVEAAFGLASGPLSTALAQEDLAFLDALRTDPGLMGFLFVHDLVEGSRRFEGLTFSFGRRAPGEPRHRDRFDVIVESEIVNGTSLGCSRMRMYVDPFARPLDRCAARVLVQEGAPCPEVAALFALAARAHAAFSTRQDKQWRHWTSDYIDYFGPRTSPVRNTHFATAIDLAEALRPAV